MKKYIVLLIILLVGCKSTRYVPINSTITHREEVRDTLYKYKLTPSFQESISDDYSFLSNAYANSEAKFENGRLYHTLTTPDSVWVFINSFTITKYVDKEIEVPVKVERELSKWERTKNDWGGFSFLLNLSLIIFLFKRKLNL